MFGLTGEEEFILQIYWSREILCSKPSQVISPSIFNFFPRKKIYKMQPIDIIRHSFINK